MYAYGGRQQRDECEEICSDGASKELCLLIRIWWLVDSFRLPI